MSQPRTDMTYNFLARPMFAAGTTGDRHMFNCVLCDDDKHPCEAVGLGIELYEALERGRRLHPWKGGAVQRLATLREGAELAEALANDEEAKRIYDEAVDVWVCARRLLDGR